MPAPATSSRHLYTEHHRGHIQPTPRLRAHRGEPLSQDHPQIPVSMPSLFRFDASAVVHTCSSSHRTPAPLTARRQPQRSPPRLLTDAACGGLESPPARRPRRTCLHHWHSTDRADDLLHHHHFPSGHTWVPIIRSWRVEQVRRSRSWVPCVAFCTGSSPRWHAWLCARDARRTSRSSCSASNSQSCAGRPTGRRSPTRTVPCSARSRPRCPDDSEPALRGAGEGVLWTVWVCCSSVAAGAGVTHFPCLVERLWRGWFLSLLIGD